MQDALMRLWNHYHLPSTVDEALDLLARYNGRARIIAGGTDLLVEIREGNQPPQEALVDVTAIAEMTQIRQDDADVYIGAGVTHTQIVKSRLLAAQTTCLVESCGVVGGPQVRNVGTLGGNVAHALPAADGTTALVALDAQAEIVLQGQRQWVPLLKLFRGPGESLLDSSRDLLVGFRLRLCTKREATAFKRIMRPQGVALPILGCAVWVQLDRRLEHYDAVRVSIAPLGPTPGRALNVEAVLQGQPVGETSIEQAVDTAWDTLKPRTSKYRATAAYRREMIAVLLRRTLQLATERAQTGQAIPEGVGLE
jgi:CO/xanthine dehydrogenase FAD-binding subunit